MGSILKFSRPRPLIRQPRSKIAEEQETREARRSLFILIGSFFVTALVMCAAVVALVSSTWTDVVIMSAFVLVFALLKIVLANVLIYTMLRYDAATANVAAPAGAVRGSQRFAPIRQAPTVKVRRRGSISKLRVTTRNGQSNS
jgi:protein-S-isoprenylcysteine O-methyltransferase Ste14